MILDVALVLSVDFILSKSNRSKGDSVFKLNIWLCKITWMRLSAMLGD